MVECVLNLVKINYFFLFMVVVVRYDFMMKLRFFNFVNGLWKGCYYFLKIIGIVYLVKFRVEFNIIKKKFIFLKVLDFDFMFCI